MRPGRRTTRNVMGSASVTARNEPRAAAEMEFQAGIHRSLRYATVDEEPPAASHGPVLLQAAPQPVDQAADGHDEGGRNHDGQVEQGRESSTCPAA